MTTAYGTRTLSVTVLSVCVDPETVSKFIEVALDFSWAITEAPFEGYISDKRRPHFGENLKSGDGCFAIVDFDLDPDEAIAACTYLQQVFGRKVVIAAISQHDEPERMLLAMRAGCTEFMRLPFDETAAAAACGRFEQQLSTRTATNSMAGSVVSFFGAKGGVGTTTLAVHLATYLVQHSKKKVLLIDNHPQFGHACVYLGIDGSKFLFQELVKNVNRLDSDLLSGFVAKHPSGLDMLSSPDVGQRARPMDAEDVASTLDFLRSEYDFVIVDCSATLHEVNLAVVAASSRVYMVATPEISAVRDLCRYIDDLQQIDRTTKKVKVVINRFSSQFAVNLEDIEKAIRLPVDFCIPNSYVELVRSANLGIPVKMDSKSGFTVELLRWANALVGTEQPALGKGAVSTTGSPWGVVKGQLQSVFGRPAAAAQKRA